MAYTRLCPFLGKGKEDFGGKDINDVLNLIPALSQLPNRYKTYDDGYLILNVNIFFTLHLITPTDALGTIINHKLDKGYYNPADFARSFLFANAQTKIIDVHNHW